MCYKIAQENKKIKKGCRIFSAPFYHSKLSLTVRSIFVLASLVTEHQQLTDEIVGNDHQNGGDGLDEKFADAEPVEEYHKH